MSRLRKSQSCSPLACDYRLPRQNAHGRDDRGTSNRYEFHFVGNIFGAIGRSSRDRAYYQTGVIATGWSAACSYERRCCDCRLPLAMVLGWNSFVRLKTSERVSRPANQTAAALSIFPDTGNLRKKPSCCGDRGWSGTDVVGRADLVRAGVGWVWIILIWLVRRDLRGRTSRPSKSQGTPLI